MTSKPVFERIRFSFFKGTMSAMVPRATRSQIFLRFGSGIFFQKLLSLRYFLKPIKR